MKIFLLKVKLEKELLFLLRLNILSLKNKNFMIEDDFYKKVYMIVRKVPYGRVTTYGAIAKFIGAPSSSRVVGWALNSSHNDSSIPAHRVVNRNGLLTGKHHFFGRDLMEQLLQNEGVNVIDNQVQEFETKFWKPK